jgi:hypothetical protein
MKSHPQNSHETAILALVPAVTARHVKQARAALAAAQTLIDDHGMPPDQVQACMCYAELALFGTPGTCPPLVSEQFFEDLRLFAREMREPEPGTSNENGFRN